MLVTTTTTEDSQNTAPNNQTTEQDSGMRVAGHQHFAMDCSYEGQRISSIELHQLRESRPQLRAVVVGRCMNRLPPRPSPHWVTVEGTCPIIAQFFNSWTLTRERLNNHT